MTDGFNTLTEKEKETLRLMVRGHDAKSMARELDLSVHTINDRLRVARRKLGVTSSREAARLLLESEGTAHEFLADNELGDAPDVDAPQSPTDPNDRHPGGRMAGRTNAWLIGGIFVMSAIALLASILLPAAQPAVSSAAEPVAQEKSEEYDERVPYRELEKAEALARTWLDLVDREEPLPDMDAGDEAGQSNPNLQGWNKMVERRRLYGRALEREAQRVDIVEGSPGDIWTIWFKTDFERLKGAYEKVTLTYVDGAFVGKDYEIR